MHKRVSHWSGHIALFSMLTHIFCCGLPFLISVLSLGAVAGNSVALVFLHDLIHGYEKHILIFSAVMICVSAVSLYIARRSNCVTEGDCHHEPCAPKKDRSLLLFSIALCLFLVNIGFFVFERQIHSRLPVPQDAQQNAGAVHSAVHGSGQAHDHHQGHDHEHDHNHDHHGHAH